MHRKASAFDSGRCHRVPHSSIYRGSTVQLPNLLLRTALDFTKNTFTEDGKYILGQASVRFTAFEWSKMNHLVYCITSSFVPQQLSQLSSIRSIRASTIRPLISPFHFTQRSGLRKNDNVSFSSRAPLLHPQEAGKEEPKSQNVKRKSRSSAAQNSLRRVAVEAQRSRDGKEPKKTSAASYPMASRVNTA